jgi:hypothetical protein
MARKIASVGIPSDLPWWCRINCKWTYYRARCCPIGSALAARTDRSQPKEALRISEASTEHEIARDSDRSEGVDPAHRCVGAIHQAGSCQRIGILRTSPNHSRQSDHSVGAYISRAIARGNCDHVLNDILSYTTETATGGDSCLAV